jgi:hypothetical protein
MPSFFGGQHADTELMMAPGRVLDPAKLFTIVPNLLRGPIVRDSGAWAPASPGPSRSRRVVGKDVSTSSFASASG